MTGSSSDLSDKLRRAAWREAPNATAGRRDGLIIHWQDEGADDSALPGKRWLQKWLEWDLSIAVPGAHMLAASTAVDRPSLHFLESNGLLEVGLPL